MPKAVAVEHAIHTVRGLRVMLDADLARLYGVSTKAFNQAVKRNATRFPVDFRFRLTFAEAGALRSQIVTSKPRGGRRHLPWAFTQEGVAMLSGVLRSPRAVAVNVGIMRAFVRLRQAAALNAELAKRLALLEAQLDQHRAESGKALAEHERHLRVVFETLRNLMAEEAAPPPPRIGFRLPARTTVYDAARRRR